MCGSLTKTVIVTPSRTRYHCRPMPSGPDGSVGRAGWHWDWVFLVFLIVPFPEQEEKRSIFARLDCVERVTTGRPYAKTHEKYPQSSNGTLIPVTSGCHFLSTDSPPACLICLCQIKDTFSIILSQRFPRFFVLN